MQQKTNGIILQNIKFQDKKNILKIYTLQHGIQSYLVHIGHSKKSKIKAAHIIGLNQVELIEKTTKNSSIRLIQDIQVTYIYEQLFSNPIKCSIAIFLNEVLLKSLKEQSENEDLYFFIVKSLVIFDNKNYEAVNFHLYFMIELSKYLGFYPNNNYSEQNCLFDIQGGVFVSSIPDHVFYTDSELSFHFSGLLQLKSSFHCTSLIRSALLELLLQLYRLHLPGFGELKSTTVLKTLLS